MNEQRLRNVTRSAAEMHEPSPPMLELIEQRASVRRARRRTGAFAACAVVLLGAGLGIVGIRGSGPDGQATPSATDLGSLTAAQFDLAIATAQQNIDQHGAIVTDAYAALVTQPINGNIGDCPTPSLRIQIVGSFPNDQVGTPEGDGTGEITDAIITVDPVTGAACQVGVDTDTPVIYPGSTVLTPYLKKKE